MTSSESYVLHRDLAHVLPTAVGGDGPYIIDSDGKRYLDGSGGPGVSCLGHSHPSVVGALREQAEKLAYAWTGFFTNEPMEALAKLLVEVAPPGALSRACFISSGSEAIEAALKLSRQFFIETGEPERTQFIARRASYHGNTLGALGVSGQLMRRATYEPMIAASRFIAPCYAYRWQRPDETAEAYGVRAADELERAIVDIGPHGVAAFLAEPIVGGTAGALLPVPGYFERVRSICDRYGVLLILDEVMCGMGRTGTMYAFEQENVAPDIVTVAKGLGAGYQPIAATIASKRVVEAIENGSGKLRHGQTYMGHAVACATALAVLRAILDEDLLANVRAMGDALEERLRDRFSSHANVGEIRGRGLVWALELVKDRSTKETFAAEHHLHARVKAEALRAGLLCYPGGGTADGESGDHILLAPPYNIEAHHLDELVDKLDTALTGALSQVQMEAQMKK